MKWRSTSRIKDYVKAHIDFLPINPIAKESLE